MLSEVDEACKVAVSEPAAVVEAAPLGGGGPVEVALKAETTAMTLDGTGAML